MAAMDSLDFSLKPVIAGSAAINRTGTDYPQLSSRIDIAKPAITVKSTIANNAAGGGDMLLSAIVAVPAATPGTPDTPGTATVDLTSFTDFLNRATQSFARIKAIELRLLSTADDATNGTACTG